MSETNGALVESPRANGLHAVRVVEDIIPTLDTARFEHMQRIATVMATSSLVPEHLRAKDQGMTVANCFLVVNQAVRWGMDPFGVAQCVSVIKGKLCYEGKLVAAVLEAKLGVRLQYLFDEAQGDQLGVQVIGVLPDETQPRTIEGTVAQWRTTGDNSPWKAAANWKRQLRYRGAREWARAHAPGILLGVYSDDELEDLSDNFRSNHAQDITPRVQLLTPPSPPKDTPKAATTPPAAPKTAEDESVEPFADPAAYLVHLDEEMGACGDKETFAEVWSVHLEASDGRIGKADQQTAEAHYERHLQRINGTGQLL